MVIDLDAILAGLPGLRKRTKREVATQERLSMVALHMTRCGYRHTRESLDALRDWLDGYGLLLAGDVGTGKTMFFKCLPNSVAILPMRECYLWGFDRLDSWLSSNADSDILVDDLGAECAANNFGSKYNAINPILERRLGSAYRTNFTTNFTSKELLAKYEDSSIVDRIFELATPHRLAPGNSLRAPSQSRKAIEFAEKLFSR